MRQVNLIPGDITLHEAAVRRLRHWGAVAVLLAAVVAVLFYGQKRFIARNEAEVDRLERRNAALKTQYAELRSLQQKQVELARKAALIKGLLSRGRVTGMIAELERALAPSAWLTYLELELRERGASGREGTGEEQWTDTGYFVVKRRPSREAQKKDGEKDSSGIVLRGVVCDPEDLSRLLNALDRSGRFHDPLLTYCRAGADGESLLEFEVSSKLKEF